MQGGTKVAVQGRQWLEQLAGECLREGCPRMAGRTDKRSEWAELQICIDIIWKWNWLALTPLTEFAAILKTTLKPQPSRPPFKEILQHVVSPHQGPREAISFIAFLFIIPYVS
ncbi:hypothetical protein BDW72DRAFT_91265 [Aspergillus terricola var. indicus]